jgi:hypothetical protein
MHGTPQRWLKIRAHGVTKMRYQYIDKTGNQLLLPGDFLSAVWRKIKSRKIAG